MIRWLIGVYLVSTLSCTIWSTLAFGRPTLVLVLIFALPLLVAVGCVVRQSTDRPNVVRIAVIMLFAIGSAAFTVSKWMDAGLHEVCSFERKVVRLRQDPRFKNVRTRFRSGKGNRIAVVGSVASTSDYDSLNQLLRRAAEGTEFGYSNRVQIHGQNRRAGKSDQ